MPSPFRHMPKRSALEKHLHRFATRAARQTFWPGMPMFGPNSKVSNEWCRATTRNLAKVWVVPVGDPIEFILSRGKNRKTKARALIWTRLNMKPLTGGQIASMYAEFAEAQAVYFIGTKNRHYARRKAYRKVGWRFFRETFMGSKQTVYDRVHDPATGVLTEVPRQRSLWYHPTKQEMAIVGRLIMRAADPIWLPPGGRNSEQWVKLLDEVYLEAQRYSEEQGKATET